MVSEMFKECEGGACQCYFNYELEEFMMQQNNRKSPKNIFRKVVRMGNISVLGTMFVFLAKKAKYRI